MKTQKIILLLASIFIISISCKKSPGSGGQTTIVGKVWEKHYILSLHDSINDHWAQEQDVYLVYGDDASFGDRTRTGPDGLFEFKYLREGSYTVYVYGDSTTFLRKAIMKKITIPKSGKTDIGVFTTKKINN